MPTSTQRVRAPFIPTYSEVRLVLPLFAGVKKSGVTHLMSSIFEQTGTPQNPVDWSEPDVWIQDRLTGADQELASRIWLGSGKKVNPRHLYGSYLFINTFQLLDQDADGRYRLQKRGEDFLEQHKTLLLELDEQEGILKLLNILSAKKQVKRSGLVAEWGEYLREYSKFGTTSTIADTLRRRLLNLLDRGLVEKTGNAYAITAEGLAWSTNSKAVRPPDILRLISHHNDKQREEFRAYLHNMPPYQFEKLVSQLLESMGYEDVETTKQSGDKGVDVVGNVEVGITSVREVVQVKRMSNNIQRHILDQLRGALPYHHAIRGTIITLSDFSKGCTEAALFPGAAPITLINGDKLIELLEEYQIGIRKRMTEVLEIDKEVFVEMEVVEEPLS
jgi:restriction system protein